MGLLDIFGSPRASKEFSRSRHVRDSVVDEKKPSPVAIIYRSEFDYISRCILDYPNIETGGQLFGYWTSTGTPVVMYVIGPGRNAQHHSTSFIQDWDYLQMIGKELHSRYRIQHIGEWHSHHQLGLAHPSGGDVNTMSYGVGKPGFPRLLLCIGNCTRTTSTLNAFNFHESAPTEYVHASWDIIDMDSPYRQIIDMDLQRILIHPRIRNASHGQIRSIKNTVRPTDSIGVHWLTESAENVETMKTFVSMVQSMCAGCMVKAEVLKTGEPQIAIKDLGISIKLPYGFPVKSPVLLKEQEEIFDKNEGNIWDIGEESLPITFGRWLSMKLSRELTQAKLMDKVVYDSIDEYSLANKQTQESHEAETRTERVGMENQILSNYFHQDAFIWSDITIVNIIAYPFFQRKQGVIRISLPQNFPNMPPEIQFGFYEETLQAKPNLSIHLSEINYRHLSELFDNADEVFCQLLKWENQTSMFKAYIIACIMIQCNQKAEKEDIDVMEYLNPLINDESQLASLVQQIQQEIEHFKQE